MSAQPIDDTDVAIVGMSGRFPGARDVDEFWRRIVAGDDCLVDLDPEQLIRDGLDPRQARDPDRVLRDGLIDDVAGFDREFFGIGSRDAALMDPQHRHFLECAWEALESAAHVPERFDGAIGVFAGCGMNTYLLENLLTNPDLVDDVGWFLLRHTGNDKDFLATSLSYRLGLRGPSVNVQTACSTSLVAVHLGVQSLLSFESDLVLAGGVTIEFPHGTGHVHREGEILSPSGRCRAFDAESDGTVLTGGIAVVALRRLTDAIDDGDPVLAVIKGSAINNDGERKVGFLAPSVDGHADVVREALSVSAVDVDTIGLLEAHGTGTAVGDPIEVAALTAAFRSSTDRTGFCRLTSTKPNIGHLDTAAGGASLIKAVQALRHATLPPLANHTAPSPLLDLDRTPFVLSATAAPWVVDGAPRRAGVSSLGVGGTNAHVIVEEAPASREVAAGRRRQPLLISGLGRQAVDDAVERLASFFERHPDADVADVANTLSTGRRAMPVRRVVTVTDASTAAAELRDPDRRHRHVAEAPTETPPIVFTFPGGGSQYVGMGANLDERFAVFHRTRAEGATLVRSLGGVDLEPLFDRSADPHLLERPTASLPAVFVTSVAMARQWMAWGVEPDAMIGHSLGEYVAAHLAGVLSFEDAMMLVVERAALMERASGDDAAMLVVSAPTDEVLPGLPDTLSLATVNADDECVIAGRDDDIAAFEGALRRRGIDTTRIALSAAAHSALLDPVLDEFEKVVRSVDLHRPQRPYVSNLTGTWITDAQATDPSYWVDHLRHTVRFRDGLRTVLEPAGGVVVECGPGNALSSYARRTGLATGAIPTLRHPDDAIDDTNHTITAFARLWTFGVDVDLEPLIGPDRRRVRLPTYPFQHERCWIEPGAARRERADRTAERLERIDDPAAMTWRPSWRQVDRAPAGTSSVTSWLVVGSGRADEVASELARRGRRVQVASTFDEDDHRGADGIVFVGGGDYDEQYERWVTQMRHAVKVLGRSDQGRLVALTTRAWGGPVQADDAAGALAAGCVLVAPAEMPGLSTALVDDDGAVDIARIVDDIETASGLVSYESGVRRVPHLLHEPPPPAERAPAIDGTWIITGGLGEVGGTLAEYLARRGARLVLVTSSPLPSPAEHDQYLRTHAIDDPTSRKIRRLRHLRAIGSDVSVLVADLDVPGAAAALLDGAEAAVGSIDGVVHAAGRLHDQLIEIADDDTIRSVIDPKARAAVELATELAARGVPRLILVSSTSTRLAPAGQAAYVAANAVLDALAGRHDGLDVTTIGFGMWAGAGMAADTALRRHVGAGTASGMSHPVLGERIEQPDGTVTSWGTLTTEHHWLVDEHRTAAGVAVVPGTGHLELMIAAVQTSPSELVTLDDVALLEPLVVPDGTDVHVRVVVDPPRADPRQVRVEASRDRAGWVVHAEATIGSTHAVAAEVEFDGGRTFDPMSTGHAHLRLGDRWHLPCDAQRTDAAATGTIRAAGAVETERETWRAHPAVVDQATGWAIALDDSDRRDLLHVPIGYRKVSWMRPLPTEVRVTAARTSEGDADVIVGDLALFDDATVCLAIEGIQLRPIESDRLAATATAPTAVHEGGGDLLDVTERLGLKADDVWPILDDVLTAPQPRTIVSAVDIDALANATFAQDEPAPTEPAPHHDGTVEERLTAIWRDLLGDDRIGPDDDFFELGGHSLVAIRLLNRVKQEFGVRVQLSAMFEASTVRAMTDLVRTAGALDAAAPAAPDDTPHIATVNSGGARRPLYVVHGAGGSVLFLWSLARAVGSDRPIHGFRAEGVDEGEFPDTSVEQMAARYVDELRRHSPGPYLLGGYSGGGIVALEMVRRLYELGEQVDHVVLFDSVPPGRAEVPVPTSWWRTCRNALRFGVGAVRPYVRHRTLGALRRYIPERPERAAEREQQERALGFETDGTGTVDLYYYFSAAADRYVPTAYDVDVTIIKADLQWPCQPVDYHWRSLIRGRLDVVTTPGDHHTMFYPEFAPALAGRVRDALDPLDEERP